MKIIAIVSAKGGVGKSSTCANLASGLAKSGRNVLVVDTDPQDALRLNLGLGLGETGGIARSVLDGVNWEQNILSTPSNVQVLPFGVVDEIERESFEALIGHSSHTLRAHLERLSLPDDTIVLVDTPPGRSAYMKWALSACDLALVVTLPDAASYATLPSMHKLIETYCLKRPAFKEYAYIINQVDRSRQLSKDVTALMRNDLGSRVAGVIHQDESVPEALAFNRNVLDYDTNSRASHDVRLCVDWLLERLPLGADRGR